MCFALTTFMCGHYIRHRPPGCCMCNANCLYSARVSTFCSQFHCERRLAYTPDSPFMRHQDAETRLHLHISPSNNRWVAALDDAHGQIRRRRTDLCPLHRHHGRHHGLRRAFSRPHGSIIDDFGAHRASRAYLNRRVDGDEIDQLLESLDIDIQLAEDEGEFWDMEPATGGPTRIIVSEEARRLLVDNDNLERAAMRTMERVRQMAAEWGLQHMLERQAEDEMRITLED